MALPSSGQLCASDINVELGKSAGTQGCLNDADWRALTNKASGQICMSDFHGKSAVSQTRITSVGQSRDGYGPWRYGYAGSGKGNYYHSEGSSTAQSFGSISATTGIITSGTIHTIYATNYYNGDFHFEIATSRSSNGGWTSVQVYSSANTNTKYTVNRTSAGAFQQLNAGDSNPQISGSYRWVFAGVTNTGSYDHGSANASTIQAIHNLFYDAYVNGRTMYFDFS